MCECVSVLGGRSYLLTRRPLGVDSKNVMVACSTLGGEGIRERVGREREEGVVRG